jgi:putative ABC transport system substrate-binding protein
MEIIMYPIFQCVKFFFFAFCFLIPSLTKAAPNLPPLKIAVIQIIEHPALNATRQGIYDELIAQGYKEGENLTWIYFSAQGKPNMAAQIAQRFVCDHVDVIVALSTPAAQAAKQAARGTNIPVIFSSVTDPLGAGLVKSLDKPNDNVTGVSNYIDVKPQLELFKRILPHLKRLGFIYNPGEANMITLLKKVKEAAPALNITIVEKTADSTTAVIAATRYLLGVVDALFISNDNTALAAFGSIIKAAEQQKVPMPVFASDGDLIENGALAVLGPNQYELGKQTARLLLQTLADRKRLPAVEFPQKVELLINTELANKLGIKIPEDLLEKVKTSN